MATYSFTDLNNETRFVGTLATTGTVGPTDPAPLNATSDATCKVELSPDNSTFSTLATTKIPNATNPANGEVQLVSVRVPAAWWVKLTLSHVTVTSATYY
jgi:hypothetical protein